MSTKNSRTNWFTNLIPGLRRESKSNNNHNNNNINEKITCPKECLTNENTISSKKIEKKLNTGYFSNSSKNQRYISSTNGSGILTFKGMDDNSKNMFAISPSNSIDNTDCRLKSDYTLIQEEDYNMNENISDIEDIYQEYSGSSIMQVSSSVNLHQTSSSTLSQLSTLSSMSVSYSPNKKDEEEENISESSSISNMQSTNSISESGITSFTSITNEIADKVNLNSNDENNTDQIENSTSSDTEYSNNSNSSINNDNNDYEVRKEKPFSYKMNDKKTKNSINVLSRFNPNKNKKKNQNQNQNKMKSKVKSKSKNDSSLRSLTMNLKSYNSNQNTSSGSIPVAIYAPEKSINNNINQYYSNSMKNSSKKIDILRNSSKKQYKNLKDSKSNIEFSKSYNNTINYQDIKEKYNESFNKVSHENIKSSNNNKSYSYSKSKRMDEVKKRKPYFNSENKSSNVERVQIQKTSSNNNLNNNNNHANNTNNNNNNNRYNSKNRNNNEINNYNQQFSLRPPAATLAKYRSHSNDFMDRAKKTPYNHKYLMNKNSMNNFNIDNYYNIVKNNNLNNYSNSYKNKPKMMNNNYKYQYNNDQDNYNSNSTSSSTLINATTSLSISPKASMSSLDSNSSNNTYNHSYEEINKKNINKSNEFKQQQQQQEQEQEQEKVNSEEEERSRRQKEIQALMSGKIHLSKYFNKHYIIGDLLGDGAFGFVLTAIRISDSTEVAIKFISKSKIPEDSWIDDPQIGRVPQEIAILNSINHPNIINFVEYINEEDYILLITELHGTEWDASNPLLNPIKNPGLRLAKQKPEEYKSDQERVIRKRTSCDLFECIDAHTKMTKATTQKIFAQIVLAIYYLHSLNIVHRDLKDENIVIDDNYHVKLIDFGSASYIPKRPENYFTRFNGTTHFASPEIVKKKAYRGPEAEIWSLGVLLFTIVFGENPFQNKDEIMEGKYMFPSKIDPDCRDLIKKLLTYDEDERITINEVVKHPFIRDEIKRLQITYSTGRW